MNPTFGSRDIRFLKPGGLFVGKPQLVLDPGLWFSNVFENSRNKGQPGVKIRNKNWSFGVFFSDCFFKCLFPMDLVLLYQIGESCVGVDITR